MVAAVVGTAAGVVVSERAPAAVARVGGLGAARAAG